MDTKTHYESLLASVYSWMIGDIESRIEEAVQFLTEHSIRPAGSGLALDLGAGHGIYSFALAKMGFEVLAIDFSSRLLAELNERRAEWKIRTVEDDIRQVEKYGRLKPAVIVCGGDTLTHLESTQEVEQFLAACARILPAHGFLVLSFRDYSTEAVGSKKIIPVKSDDHRILTCMLDIEIQSVVVTDLLYEKNAAGWTHRASSYKKTRIAPADVRRWLLENKISLVDDRLSAGMWMMAGKKD